MEYLDKFNLAIKNTVYFLLNDECKDFIKNISFNYLLTFQDIKIVCEITKDLSSWGKEYTEELKFMLKNISIKEKNPKLAKKEIISKIKQYYENIKSSEKNYFYKEENEVTTEGLKCNLKDISDNIFGACPVYSEKTVCCGLKTLDVVQNCPFNCSYCTIQTFYGDDYIFVNNLKDKLKSLKIDKDKFYHIGTGQSSDALVWGNKYNILDDLINFAKDNQNVLLEFKTKSSNISYFVDNHNNIPANVVCSWTLNTDKIIGNEEHGTASLKKRLDAAKKLADCNIKVAFHFHPIIYYKNWEIEYKEIVDKILNDFHPHNISFISFGSLTFIKPVIKQIREKKVNTKILQMPTAFDPNGKITYPDDLKIKLYKTIYEGFKKFYGEVFFYLCMEKREIWEQVFSYTYENNEDFLLDFGKKTINF